LGFYVNSLNVELNNGIKLYSFKILLPSSLAGLLPAKAVFSFLKQQPLAY